MKSPIAKEIQKLRKSGSSDSEIVEFLLETDGLTKLASPKSKDQETGVRLKRQDVIFTATPPPIKLVLQPDSSEMIKPRKQLKRTVEIEKINNEERIPIKENNGSPRNNDKNTTKPVNIKFQQKIKIKNAKRNNIKIPNKRKLKQWIFKIAF